MARSRIVLHQKAIDALVLDDGVAQEMEERGERVAAAARATAPVASGAYRDSIEVVSRPEGGVNIEASVRYAIFVEADTGTLARALDAAGGER